MEKKNLDFNQLLQILQILVIAIGIAGLFVRLGEYQATQMYNTRQLQELKDIVEGIIKSQIEFAATDATLKERIDALRLRIDRIESND
jgi:uncharacterized ion transporter superfamily protein YfcC